ncbi:sulfate permease, SulP family [Corynebacterium coyleae]|uniref:SulP family inorganic anion transporter n=1 Tax=Corynebacterium coyleae TaxID=53374 RepID=A0ABX8KYC3_9CORY|nr:SulP family inorganic anion transporter [Corynebacterium coyleae]QXB19210.1 SulP family inorganic anion transporter [Corynebacterium coyleae]WJY80806.1 Bicarbonate transporter BicA [Corynebacterium coyleae]SEB50401.1 sulfate permease, SulP family [Corynebacterium coyleae]
MAAPHTETTREPLAPTGVVESFRYAFSSAARLRREVLAGLTVALALIPEAIAFSILAGVDPALGLFASVIMAITIAFTGGRPAMISAATGAVALVIAPVAREYGLDYFVATVILAGVLQIVLAALGVAKLQRFIPRSVMVGFVNALGILIFSAQLEHLIDVPWPVYPLVAAGIAIMIFWPKVTGAIPGPLITIILLTGVVVAAGIRVPTVSDMGELPHSLPSLFIPDVPLTLETLRIIGPYALGMAVVGLMESLMTAKLVDDITDTHSNKTRESWGQGVANIASGFFGGMGGCAMIGQTMINVKESGARTRLSTLLAGVFLLALILVLGDVVGMIPMAALVAIMIMVSVGTIDWHSIHPRTLKLMPVSETIVMVVTVAATLITSNLAVGVVLGVVTAMIMFARRVAHLASVEKVAELDTDGDGRIDTRTYRIHGQLFWASSNDLVYAFDYADDADHIIIDLSHAEIWDASTVATLDSITQKFRDRGKTVTITGLDGPSKDRLDRLTGQLP